MCHILWFVFVLLQYPCQGLPRITDAHVVNLKEHREFPDKLGIALKNRDFTQAKGNQSCSQILGQSQSYIETLPPLSGLYVRPAIGLGLIKIGCLSETDPYFKDLIEDEHVRDMYRLLSEQWEMSADLTSHFLSQKYRVDSAALRFNLDSFSPVRLSKKGIMCSGFRQEIKGVTLLGFELGKHPSLQEAALQCNRLGPSCAGVFLDDFGTFHAVAMNGSYIIPQVSSSLWLHRCFGAHVKRRSTTVECQNEQEERIYNVIQWIPLVSGWYNAGSAIYYASKGCSTQAEGRAIEASIDLGSDALLAMTGGTSGAVGLAVKPALKAGAKAAIDYFRKEPTLPHVDGLRIIGVVSKDLGTHGV
uniref:Apolipoprotein F n=1 Tax=Leptobrachium leishanense TaxID=445787 RepID=A0A8C5M6F7_9ANUR